jgi:hypothetical protein
MFKLFMLLFRLLLCLPRVNVMKNTIGTFALRFMAAAVLFAPTVAAQAQGTSQSVSVSHPPPQPAPPAASEPEPPVKRTITNETIPYDANVEARKAQLRASEHRVVSPSLSLCPPPYRMTARDGCQR